jgi:hypothetical protein
VKIQFRQHIEHGRQFEGIAENRGGTLQAMSGLHGTLLEPAVQGIFVQTSRYSVKSDVSLHRSSEEHLGASNLRPRDSTVGPGPIEREIEDSNPM